jgi:DNA polymerase-3 subunit beta
MRCNIGVKALAAALKFPARAIPNKVPAPIVGNARLDLDGTSLAITGTDLNQQHVAAVDVLDLAEPGAITVPGQRLSDLIGRLPPAAEVTVKVEDGGQHCLISSGRGRWKLPILPAADFPLLTPPGASAAVFTLPQAEARRLLRRLTHAIADDDRYYLNGVHLHRADGKLIAVTTNGRALARIVIDLDPGQDLKVIVPTRAIAVLNELAAHGDVDVAVDRNKISLRSGPRAIVSKLIDAAYPDYARALPGASKNRIEVHTADLIASIERHKAAAELDLGIGLTWQNGTLTTCLSRNEAAATEEIDGIGSSGKGRVAASADYLLDTLRALDAKTVVIEHEQHSTAIRISSAAEPTTLMIVATLTWLASVVADDRPAPPVRDRRGK